MEAARLVREKAGLAKQQYESEEEHGEQILAKVKVENIAKIVVEDDFEINDI